MAEKDSQPINEEMQVINYNNLQNKIYNIRGVQVMLDYDLAEIYGYDTKYLNRQVARNREKFEGENFMFRLTKAEASGLSRCHFGTLNTGRGNNIKYLPYAFTEQGIYMLMTVLRGDLAIKQSRALVMAFKAMKDYIMENSAILEQRDQMKLMMQISRKNFRV